MPPVQTTTFQPDSLTQHYKVMHVKKGTSGQPFPCPECRRSCKPDHLITSPSSWSSHVEVDPRKEYAPILRTDPRPPPTLKVETICCPFCGLHLPIRGYGPHVKVHVPAGAGSEIFSRPFPCRACCNDPDHKTPDVRINGCSDWDMHVYVAHREDSRTLTVGISRPVRRRKRGRDDGTNYHGDPVPAVWQFFSADGPSSPLYKEPPTYLVFGIRTMP